MLREPLTVCLSHYSGFMFHLAFYLCCKNAAGWLLLKKDEVPTVGGSYEFYSFVARLPIIPFGLFFAQPPGGKCEHCHEPTGHGASDSARKKSITVMDVVKKIHTSVQNLVVRLQLYKLEAKQYACAPRHFQ